MKTLGKLFLERLETEAHDFALGEIKGQEIEKLSFTKYFEKTELIALGLKKLGLQTEQKVALLSQTCLKWHLFDAASIHLRAIVVPIYPSYLPKEILFLLNHSESSVLVIEDNEQFEKFLEIQNQVKTIKTLIALTELSQELVKKLAKTFSLSTYEDLLKVGQEEKKLFPEFVREQILLQKEEDIVSIIYTSGTTGEPKGAVVTQGAFATLLLNLRKTFTGVAGKGDSTLTFLPLSHVLGRMESWLPVGLCIANIYAENIKKVVENIALARPTVMIAVPRIFEKIYDRIQQTLEEGNLPKKMLFRIAEKSSRKYFSKIEKSVSPSPREALKEKLAYKVVFSKINKRFGGRIKFFISGGAPISEEIIRFMRSAHLPIVEGYGLTETIAPCFVNPLDAISVGSVGLPIANTSVKIAEDGEILIKSEALFQGYYKNPEATADVLKDGWLYTGDIGHLDDKGYLFITDRKKDLIITSGGKNVAPQMIENMMKQERHISHFVVIGDRQKFLTGIVGIEKENFEAEIQKWGLDPQVDLSTLSQHPEMRKLIESEIERVNEKLARFETIKSFYIAPQAFTTENGFLTPSQKIKRKVVLESFKNEIDAMYQEEKL